MVSVAPCGCMVRMGRRIQCSATPHTAAAPSAHTRQWLPLLILIGMLIGLPAPRAACRRAAKRHKTPHSAATICGRPALIAFAPPAAQMPFAIRNPEELAERQQAAINDIAGVLGIEPDAAARVLRKYKWCAACWTAFSRFVTLSSRYIACWADDTDGKLSSGTPMAALALCTTFDWLCRESR